VCHLPGATRKQAGAPPGCVRRTNRFGGSVAIFGPAAKCTGRAWNERRGRMNCHSHHEARTPGGSMALTPKRPRAGIRVRVALWWRRQWPPRCAVAGQFSLGVRRSAALARPGDTAYSRSDRSRRVPEEARVHIHELPAGRSAAESYPKFRITSAAKRLFRQNHPGNVGVAGSTLCFHAAQC